MAPRVILLAEDDPEDEALTVRAPRLGANSYLHKPVDFTEFVAAVQHLGLYWMVLNETPPGDS